MALLRALPVLDSRKSFFLCEDALDPVRVGTFLVDVFILAVVVLPSRKRANWRPIRQALFADASQPPKYV